MSKFDTYREQYASFVYHGFSMDVKDGVLSVVYNFETPGLSDFHPTWKFPVKRDLDDQAMTCLRELVFQLGMVETISYYKIVCPKKVIVECGSMTGDQILWWKKLYYNGLGEFMYRNGIEVSEDELLTIECRTPEERGDAKPFQDPYPYKGFLVPVGGGKDSVVTLETLKGHEDIMTFHINGGSAIDNVIQVFNDQKNDYRAERTLDPNMLALNEKGYLNGHTPFSALAAFASTIAAFLSGRKYIALSNETSANETTVKDSFVNHQYSKSYEFEQDFQNYIRGIVTSDIHYFSYLRPDRDRDRIDLCHLQGVPSGVPLLQPGKQEGHLVLQLPEVPVRLHHSLPVPFRGRGDRDLRGEASRQAIPRAGFPGACRHR